MKFEWKTLTETQNIKKRCYVICVAFGFGVIDFPPVIIARYDERNKFGRHAEPDREREK